MLRPLGLAAGRSAGGTRHILWCRLGIRTTCTIRRRKVRAAWMSSSRVRIRRAVILTSETCGLPSRDPAPVQIRGLRTEGALRRAGWVKNCGAPRDYLSMRRVKFRSRDRRRACDSASAVAPVPHPSGGGGLPDPASEWRDRMSIPRDQMGSIPSAAGARSGRRSPILRA